MIPKFRAWYQGDMWIVINIRWKNDGIVLDLFNRSTRVYCIPGDLCFLLQSTGLKDKAGSEIFEGDICEFIIGPDRDRFITLNGHKACLVVIEMERAAWGFRHIFPETVLSEDAEWKAFIRPDDDDWRTDYFTVIGNVHQNPELLK